MKPNKLQRSFTKSQMNISARRSVKVHNLLFTARTLCMIALRVLTTLRSVFRKIVPTCIAGDKTLAKYISL